MRQNAYYRYVDDCEYALIRQTNAIEPHPHRGVKFYSPDRHETGYDAQARLALAYTLTWRTGPIPEDKLPDFDYREVSTVATHNGQPGGVREVATSHVAYLLGFTQLNASDSVDAPGIVGWRLGRSPAWRRTN